MTSSHHNLPVAPFTTTEPMTTTVANVTLFNGIPNVYITTPYLLRIIFYIIAACGITLNIFTITIIFNYKPMLKQLMNVFIINQAIIDALAATILIFSTLFQNNTDKKRAGYVPDEALCRVWFSEMFMWGMLLSSTYGTIAVTFERYLAVVHPIWHKAKFTRKIAFIMIILVWLIGPCYYYPYSIATSQITADGVCTVYTYYEYAIEQHFSAAFEFAITYVFPLLSLAYFYIAMILALCRMASIHPLVVVEKNDGRNTVSEVVPAIKKGDKTEPMNKLITDEIQHKHQLALLTNAGSEEASKDANNSLTLSSTEPSLSASKSRAAEVEVAQTLNVKLLRTINEHERAGSISQAKSLAKLKGEANSLPSITVERTNENVSGIEMKSVSVPKEKSASAPKESLSTAMAKRNVIKTLALVSCGFILCWTWAEVTFFVNDLGLINIDFSGAFYNFTTVMAFTSCCINPVIYCIQYRQFQKGVKYVLYQNRVWKYFLGGWKSTAKTGPATPNTNKPTSK